MAARSATRRFKYLLAGILAALVVWSIVWFVAATIVDRQIARAEKMALDRDAILVCAERHVTGYPFRVVVRCESGSKVGANGRKIALGGLTVAAQVYDPAHIIARVDTPARLHFANGAEIEANFGLAHASAQIDLSSGALRQLVAEIVDMGMSAGPATLAVAELDLSLRRNPDMPDNLDIALQVRDAVPREGLEPFDFILRGQVAGGSALLQGAPRDLAQRAAVDGLPIIIEAAEFACGDMVVTLKGTLSIKPDGLIDGTVDVAVAGYEAGLPYVSTMNPHAEMVLTTLLTNFFANAPVTMVGNKEARSISITIDDGRIKPGGWFTVGTIPPLPFRFY